MTGTVKLANEEKDPDYGVDREVKLMSREANAKADDQSAAPAAAGSPQSEPKCRLRRPCRRTPPAIREAQSSLEARLATPPPPAIGHTGTPADR